MRIPRRSPLWLLGPGVALGALAQQVQAQQATDTELEEVIVSASKRETNLQETPIAISVISDAAIADRHIESLLNLADGGVPSLRVATFEARQSALTVGIRGIVPFDQNQTARDAGVGVYMDGIYLGRSQGLNAALFDVERIEVLRGPAGTLFGRNTEGGAVSIVTKEPTGEFGGRVSGGVGNYGSYDTQVHVDLPAVANIAFKVDGVIQHQDATTTNPAPGQYGWDYYNRAGGRVSALWKPVDGFSALLSFDKAKDQNTPFYSQLVNYNPNGLATIAPLPPLLADEVAGGDKRISAAPIGVPQQPTVDDTEGYGLTLKYKVIPDLELRSITGWRSVTTAQWDNSGGAERTPAFGANAGFSRYSLSNLAQHQFSQEFQAVGSASQFDYVLGAYYFKEQAREYAATPNSNLWNADGTGYSFLSPYLPSGILPASGPYSAGGWAEGDWYVLPAGSAKNPGSLTRLMDGSWMLQRDSRATTESYAGFGQATWNVTDVFHVTGGVRYTKDKRDYDQDVVAGAFVPVRSLNFDKGHADPMLTLAWDAADGVNLYGKFSTGFRAGGVNDRSSGTKTFDPEKVKAYEIGAKTEFFDRKVRLNLAAYRMDRTGTQVDFDYVDPATNLHTEETVNAPGKSKLSGYEAELTARAAEGLTFGLAYAYTKAKIPDTVNPLPGVATSGQVVPVFVVFTPKQAVTGNVDYEVPAGAAGSTLRLHLDGSYAGRMHTFQNETTLTDTSFIVNASVALADIALGGKAEKLTLSLWSRNLLDEDHIYRRSNANNAVLGSYANFNPPRTFGVEARIAF